MAAAAFLDFGHCVFRRQKISVVTFPSNLVMIGQNSEEMAAVFENPIVVATILKFGHKISICQVIDVFKIGVAMFPPNLVMIGQIKKNSSCFFKSKIVATVILNRLRKMNT